MSAHRRTAASAAASTRLSERSGRPGAIPAARPTTPTASRTIPLPSASHERSPAIDHQMVRPVQATSPTAPATAATPARSRRGSRTAPHDQPTTIRTAVTTAAVPSVAVASVPDASPAKSAHPRSRETAPPRGGGAPPADTAGRRPFRIPPSAASMARHRTTRTCRFSGSRRIKTYNSFTLHSPPAQWRPEDLPNSRATQGLAAPPLILHRASNSHLSPRPAPRTRPDRARDRLPHRRQGRDGGIHRSLHEHRVLRVSRDRRLVRRREGREDLSPSLLSRGNQEAAARRSPVLERQGGDHPRSRVRAPGQAGSRRERHDDHGDDADDADELRGDDEHAGD